VSLCKTILQLFNFSFVGFRVISLTPGINNVPTFSNFNQSVLAVTVLKYKTSAPTRVKRIMIIANS